MSFWNRILGITSKAKKTAETDKLFAVRFHRFKLFLTAHTEAYSEIMNMEERLASPLPIGMPFLRMCTAKLTVATMQCAIHLDALSNTGYTARLKQPLDTLRASTAEILTRHVHPVHGPLVVPYQDLTEEHADCVAPELLALGSISRKQPDLVPAGFVLTGGAWQLYMDSPELHDEIDRIFQISTADPSMYNEVASAIREFFNSMPLPNAMVTALKKAISEITQKYGPVLDTPGYSLRIRCHPVLAEHSTLDLPDQYLETPLKDTELLLHSIRNALALAYRPRSIIYRLKMGLRDRGMPFCVSCTIIPKACDFGSVHVTPAATDNTPQPVLHLRRTLRTKENDTLIPKGCSQKILDAAVQLGEAHANYELDWVTSCNGTLYIVGFHSLPPQPQVPQSCPSDLVLLLQGGIATCHGIARGRPYLVRNITDALLFPMHSLLIAKQAAPRWAFLLQFAAGAVAEEGSTHGSFAATSRRLVTPALVNAPQAVSTLASSNELELDTSCPGVFATAISEGAQEPVLWKIPSPLSNMLQEVAKNILPLTLPDADAPDFKAQNCKTYKDIITYAQDQAVREMLGLASKGKSKSTAPAKQLVCDVPKQFWVLDLENGYTEPVEGNTVKLTQIACKPMRAMWEGFVDKPWDGPPQLDAKGFMSVLFEASINPNLDPAVQSSIYTEKNIFMIARTFFSMRCRFGFHFLSLDCLVGEREQENFIIFQFKGGAANESRRVRRVKFVAELLQHFEFTTEITGDALTSRMEKGSEEHFLRALRLIGYLVMHTRQLDMIMGDENALKERREQMLADMLNLAQRKLAFEDAKPNLSTQPA